jgi:alpha-1,2-glucosyltransferase
MANFILIPCLVVINLFIANRFNKALSFYMDEEFHLDQTVHYLQGDYTYWNPKLTTFPGLFIISSWLFFICSAFIGTDAFSFFRLINSLYGAGFGWLVGDVDRMIPRDKNFLFQMICIFLPVNYFFNFLYYTDSLSTLLVFAFYAGVYNRINKKYLFLVFFLLIKYRSFCSLCKTE